MKIAVVFLHREAKLTATLTALVNICLDEPYYTKVIPSVLSQVGLILLLGLLLIMPLVKFHMRQVEQSGLSLCQSN